MIAQFCHENPLLRRSRGMCSLAGKSTTIATAGISDRSCGNLVEHPAFFPAPCANPSLSCLPRPR